MSSHDTTFQIRMWALCPRFTRILHTIPTLTQLGVLCRGVTHSHVHEPRGDVGTTPGPLAGSQESTERREQSNPESLESCKAEEAEAGQPAAWGGWVRLKSARLLRRVKELSTEDLQEILRMKGSS